jgi:hypothetical protein
MVRTRREFLADVGKGMLVAGIGSDLAADLGLASARADEAPGKLTFGELEPLVCQMQETPADKLLPILVEQWKKRGYLTTPREAMRDWLAAAALANARTFGGEDYIGFHTMMALAPSYHMAGDLAVERSPLPVLKVIYRNSNQIQAKGGRKNEVLHHVEPGPMPDDKPGGQAMFDALRRKDLPGGEQLFAGLMKQAPGEAFDHLLPMVSDQLDVHRIVMPYRAWDLLPLIGKEHAHTMLRQSVHYCMMQEKKDRTAHNDGPRALVPKLLDQYKLVGRPAGKRLGEDTWVDRLSDTIFRSTPEQAADAVAAALAEGFTSEVIGEAISLAANQLVLRDEGRSKQNSSANKPEGSVHGDGVGVHACDTINAWRNMAKVSNPRNRVVCLILAAYNVARDRGFGKGDFLTWEPYPRADVRAKFTNANKCGLLAEAEDAIKYRDQALACAAIQRCGELGMSARPVFQLLLRYAVSEDGALHAEKYYRTVMEEFAAIRPAFRWRQLVALARVTASEYGYAAPGYAEACRLLQR